MKWFRRSSPKRDASPSKSPSTPTMFRWFRRSTVERRENPSQLKSEIDVVPRTEITASRQALDNINVALHAGESSGATSKTTGEGLDQETRSACINQYCCGLKIHSEQDDNGEDESIKNYKNCKSFIDNLRAADNNAHAFEESFAIETSRRRLSTDTKYVKNHDYIIFFDPCFDYGMRECPDSMYPSVIDAPAVRYGKYVQLKTRQQRQYSCSYDIFTSSDTLNSDGIDKSSLNYRLLSNVEKQLDSASFNLLNCHIFNTTCRRIQSIYGTIDDESSMHEDFNDDNKSTRMSGDTRIIKEFYRLSLESHILIHFYDIKIERGRSVEPHPKKFFNFLNWITLKGKEITEEQKIEGASWIKAILKFWKKIRK